MAKNKARTPPTKAEKNRALLAESDRVMRQVVDRDAERWSKGIREALDEMVKEIEAEGGSLR